MKLHHQFLSATLVLMLLAGCGTSTPKTPDAPATQPEITTPEITTPEATAPETTPPETTPPETTVPETTTPETTPPETTVPETTSPEATPPEVTGMEDWSWFDDAVFIGDSVSLKLKNYVTKMRQTDPEFFGKAQFLTSGSLGSGNALWEVSDKSVHPSFRGEKMPLEDSVPLTGAKKVYIMLGTNDIALYGIDDSVANMATLLERIQTNAPDVSIYVQSATPICEGAEKKNLNNENLTIYNEKLQAMCEEKGYAFVNVTSVMQDENGFLPRDYCSDPDGMGIHFTELACDIWMDYLKTDAQSRI